MNFSTCSNCKESILPYKRHCCKNDDCLPSGTSSRIYNFQFPTQEYGNVQQMSTLPRDFSHPSVILNSNSINLNRESARQTSDRQDQASLHDESDNMSVAPSCKLPSFQSTFFNRRLQNVNYQIPLASYNPINQFPNLKQSFQLINQPVCTTSIQNETQMSFGRASNYPGYKEQTSSIHTRKRKYSYSALETPNKAQAKNPLYNSPSGDYEKLLDTSPLGSTFQMPPNEVQANLNVSLQTSSEDLEPGYRFENSNYETQKRKSSSSQFLFQQNICEASSSISFYAATSDKSEMSLEEEKLHSFTKDKEFYMESPEGSNKKFHLDSQNIATATNLKQSLSLTGHQETNVDIVKVSRDLTVGDISSEKDSQVHNRSGAMSANVKEIIDSTKQTNAVAGPSRIRLRSLKPAEKKKLTCDICSKTFKCKFDLDTHYRTHTGEQPFVCKECNTCFSQKCNLTRHSLTHQEEKPYKCSACEKSYADKRCYKRHYESNHT